MHKSEFSNALKLFQEEQEALRVGSMEKVAAIGQQKEAILADLEGLKLSREQAVRIKEEAEKSARMLAAAIEGVKQAKKRLSALENIRDGLSVYTADGDRKTVAKSNRGLHHKL